MKMDSERTKRDEIKARRRLKAVVWDNKRDTPPVRKLRSRSNSTSRTRTANWTHTLDVSLLTILKQEYVEGNFVKGQFTKCSWSRIVPTFNAKTGLELTKDHLTNRLKVLKSVFRLYDELAVMGGWLWDPDRSVPRPDNPADWDRIIAINPQYAKCREKPCPEYPILKLLFTKNATNQTELDAAMAVELTDKDEEKGSSSSLRLLEKNTPNHHHHHQYNSTTPPPTYPTTDDDDSSSDITEKSLNITKALEELVELSRRQQEIIQDILNQEISSGQSRPYSTEQCIAKLKTVRNLSSQAFLACCEAFRDKHERKVFMSLHGKTLHAWIERMVSIQGQPPILLQPLHVANPVNHARQSQEVDFP